MPKTDPGHIFARMRKFTARRLRALADRLDPATPTDWREAAKKAITAIPLPVSLVNGYQEVAGGTNTRPYFLLLNGPLSCCILNVPAQMIAEFESHAPAADLLFDTGIADPHMKLFHRYVGSGEMLEYSGSKDPFDNAESWHDDDAPGRQRWPSAVLPPYAKP